ncbi:MAG TPA: phosphate ABC transporter permease PstA [Candidatus Sulfomarinibacteraceae bacterium]|nr:phosphate ABC transporter permease PstA [Candidatus Sulfomarinibacteraceae bacterium]
MTSANNHYPEGKALANQVAARHRSGVMWRVLFQFSTIVGIIALSALLYNILNQTFGLVAVINDVEPQTLALEYRKVQILSAPNTAVSDDEALLVETVAGDPLSVSVLNRELYRQNREWLTAIAIDGVDGGVLAADGDLIVVTSNQNTFLSGMSLVQLQQAFTTAERWSDIDSTWPDQPLQRYLPGTDSATLHAFTEAVFDTDLRRLPHEALVGILAANISNGVGRRLEREQRFFDQYLVFESAETYQGLCRSPNAPAGCTAPPRSEDDVYNLLQRYVIQPDVVATWSLVDSLFRRAQIVTQAQADFPEATIEYRSWLTRDFVTSPQNSQPEIAGVRTALLGSLWVVAITILFSFPIGVGAAIYLEEYARDNRLNRFIQTNINNLAGVPSIIYGMLGLAIFVRLLESITSGAAFGSADPTTANGRTILSAGMTLGLLILPIIIINAQEAIRAVPGSLRQASYGLGATKWQTIWSHVLPNALPGILTGTILSMSRAIGETAPLVVVGASTFITVDPNGPFAKFTTLPIQIYQWTSRPQGEFRNIAAAAIVVLLILLLSLNASAVFLRNRFSKRLS